MELSDYFSIKYGDPFSREQDYEKGQVPVVKSSSLNNGVTFFINIEPNYSNVISVSRTGSVCESFYHPYPCFITDDCMVLIPKVRLTEQEMLYIAYCLTKNKGKFNYSRKVTPARLEKTQLPSFPEWLSNHDIPNKPKREAFKKKMIQLSSRVWLDFPLNTLFNIEKGERLTKVNRITGDIPLITASSENNGISSFLDKKQFVQKKCFKNCITVDMFFNVFYHHYEYLSDDNVHTLIPKFNDSLSIFSYIFLVTILSANNYKYAYGRQVRLKRLEREVISLPADKKGNPDWKFMEEYIKSLPYSSNLESTNKHEPIADKGIFDTLIKQASQPAE